MRSSGSGHGFTFAYFTDTHVAAGGTIVGPEGAWEVDPNQTLRQVVNVLGELGQPPAFAIIGGDLVSPDLVVKNRSLTEADYEPSYALLREIVSPLGCPIHMLLGNHDNRRAFHRVMKTGSPLDTPHDYSFDFEGYHFVALDSLEAGEPGGRLSADQLGWLSQDLADSPSLPTLAFVHHHPVPVGNVWIDSMPLHNGQDLLEVLNGYPQVRGLFCGHVHMEHQVERGNVTIYTSPSTCFQISQTFNGRRLLPGPPAFRLVTVDELGLASRVVYLHSTGI